MRRNRVLYALTLLACVIFSVAYRSRISAVLLTAVACYLPLALAFAAVNLLCAAASFTDKRGVYEKNTPFEVRILIRNRFVFACAPLEILCSIPDRDTGLFAVKSIYTSLPPLGKSRISVACMHKYRGCYKSRLESVTVYDPLRIIRLSRRLHDEMTQVFLPRKIPLGDLISDAASGGSASPSRLLNGEKEEFSHVRDYRAGDIIQLVHWKLTAKQDELMIKQFDEVSDRRCCVLCDYAFDDNESALMPRADGIIETAIAVTMSAVEAGVRTVVDFGTVDRSFVSEVSDKGSFDRFYEMMSIIPAKIDAVGMCEMIDRRDFSDASAVFLVTGRLTEKLAARAEALAESISGMVVLAYVNIAGSIPEEYAAGRRFIFMNIAGSSEDALQNAVDECFR